MRSYFFHLIVCCLTTTLSDTGVLSRNRLKVPPFTSSHLPHPLPTGGTKTLPACLTTRRMMLRVPLFTPYRTRTHTRTPVRAHAYTRTCTDFFTLSLTLVLQSMTRYYKSDFIIDVISIIPVDVLLLLPEMPISGTPSPNCYRPWPIRVGTGRSLRSRKTPCRCRSCWCTSPCAHTALSSPLAEGSAPSRLQSAWHAFSACCRSYGW
jgi:hypothetical protein